jgi:glucosamine--fructose-6-phosphate aminotransferase (isomerizing)
MRWPSEGALKLKEISYIHAEVYAHLVNLNTDHRLVDKHVPVIMAPRDAVRKDNFQHARSHGARWQGVVDHRQTGRQRGRTAGHDPDARGCPFALPILYAIPAQLLAYHTAVAKGTDVDQLRTCQIGNS